MEEEFIVDGFRKPSFVTSPSNYSQSEIITMQQDAVKRVNEMREQAMRHINSNVTEDMSIIKEQPIVNDIANVEKNEKIVSDFQEPVIPVADNIMQPTTNSLAGIFDKLDLDSEKIILIGLMLLLMNEGADNTLLMALGYILL